MWIYLMIFSYLLNNGFAQIFEGSAGDSGDTITERFVNPGNDAVITDTCVRQPLAGLGCKINGVRRTHIFICPNGQIQLSNPDLQNWPYNFPSLPTQRDEVVFAPYWARVDLSAFVNGQSRMLFKSYHKDINYETSVFDRVNGDVNRLSGQGTFNATWVSVITWRDVKAFGYPEFGGRNQFQAVFISDDDCCFVEYNYADIDWAVPAPRAQYERWVNTAGLPVMGWSIGRRIGLYRNNFEYRNLPSSGTVNAEDIDDTIGNLGRGQWIFDFCEREQAPAILECNNWFTTARTIVGNLRLQCPPNSRVAIRDKRFTRQDFLGTRCWVNRFPVVGNAVRCCYHSSRGRNNLMRDLPFPGSVLLLNPLYLSSDDNYGYQKCCVESNFCRAYFSRRPKQRGRFYKFPRKAWGLGDPHYNTMDQMNYTFNGCGEYMFVDGNNTQFQIQVRFSRVEGAGLGTVISAMVIKQEGSPAIQINHVKAGDMRVLVDGKEYDYNSFNSSGTPIQNSIFVTKSAANQLEVLTDTGHWVEVTREPQNLVVVVVLGDSLFGNTRGLLGNWSGTADDDFLLPNGTVLMSKLSDEQIHFDFGEKWRLTTNQSLFVNTSTDGEFFCPTNYMPIFFSNFTFPNGSIESEALSICKGNLLCQFDIAASLDLQFGEVTANTSNTIAAEQVIIDNTSPTFSVEEVVFNMTLGETFEYTAIASDADGDALEISVIGLPAGATATVTGNTVKFSWTVNSTEEFNMTFVATDSKNASTSLFPFINICACKNGGKCFKIETSPQLTQVIFERFNVWDCECVIGFTGRFCETVKDFCQTGSGSPCHPLVSCTNSPTGFICGPCPSGYEGEGQNCTDSDECIKGTDNCQQRCINTAGSFECACNSGYKLNTDKKNCDDINECDQGSICVQNCASTPGSFSCSCNQNFIIDPSNPRNCIAKTACPATHNCQQVCSIDQTTNQQVCSCNRGYRPQVGDITKCVDIDECEESRDPCTQLCTNTAGSYTCSCIKGYTLQNDQYTCQDDNECVDNSSSCNSTSGGEQCIDLAGSFKCECNENQGLSRINGTCQVPLPGQVVPKEPAPDPAVPTQNQTENAVQLKISNFQSDQWDKKTDAKVRSAIAAALTRYCNVNKTRMEECGLPRSGFTFSELHIHRLPNHPRNEGNDSLLSVYAVYPDGVKAESNLPVPKAALLNALNEENDRIQQDSGLQLQTTTEEGTPGTRQEDDGADWRLALGISVGVALILLMGIAVAFIACRGPPYAGIRGAYHVNEVARRLSWNDMPDTSFSLSGETYQGFDADGLPVQVDPNSRVPHLDHH